MHRVLYGRPGQEQPVPAVEAKEGLPSCARRALDRLGLVEDHVLPLDTLEVLLVRHDLYTHRSAPASASPLSSADGDRTHQLIRRDEHMERRVLVVADLLPVPELSERRSILNVSPVRETLELRDEASDLLLPVVKRRGGRDDEERTPDVVYLGEVGHQRD